MPMTGRVWVHKGDKVKSVFACDETKYLEDGWSRGRGYSPSEGLVWINKDGRDKRVTKESVDSYVSQGWNVGRHFTPINRGKRYVNKDGQVISVDPNVVDIYVENGWNVGFPSDTKSTAGTVSIVSKETGEKVHVSVKEAKSLVTSGEYDYVSSRRVHMYHSISGNRVMVAESEVSEYLSNGYVFGRNTHTSKLYWIHNDELMKNKRVEEKELPTYLSQGWIRGQARYRKS